MTAKWSLYKSVTKGHNRNNGDFPPARYICLRCHTRPAVPAVLMRLNEVSDILHPLFASTETNTLHSTSNATSEPSFGAAEGPFEVGDGCLHPIFSLKPQPPTSHRKKRRASRRKEEDKYIESSSESWSENGVEQFEDDDEVSDIDDVLLGADGVFQPAGHFDCRPGESPWSVGTFKRRKKRSRKDRMLFSQKKTRKRKTAASVSEMSPEIEGLMRNANDAFLERNIPQAVAILEEIIKQAPGLHDPFHLLGLIYEKELNDPIKALDCYFLCVHLVPEDRDLWRRVGNLANEQGRLRQAIYCYKKCLSIQTEDNRLDETTTYDLASCYVANSEFTKAARKLEMLFRLHPRDPFLGRELAKCYHQHGDLEAAVTTLESCVSVSVSVEEWDTIVSQGHAQTYLVAAADEKGLLPSDNQGKIILHDPDATNMLAEVYVECGKFEACELLLSPFITATNMQEVHLDLIVKLAASQVYVGQESSPIVDYALASLLDTDTPRDSFHDLYVLLAESFYKRGKVAEALKLFKEVASVQNVRADAAVWVKIARCQLQVEGKVDGRHTASLDKCILEPDSVTRASIVRNLRNDTEARLMLSQVLTKLGRNSDTGQIVLSMPAKDASNSKSYEIPEPIPAITRQSLLQSLQSRLSSVVSGDDILTERERNLWISDFLRLVEDSELDTQRVIQSNFDRKLNNMELDPEAQRTLLKELGLNEVAAGSASSEGACGLNKRELDTTKGVLDCVASKNERRQRRPTGQSTTSNSFTYLKIKQDLNLKSLEDLLTWKDFAFFLETGIGVVMKAAGMYRVGVELIEAILTNKRSIRTQQYDLDRRLFLAQLKRLSLRMAIDGGLYRIALSYIRERYLRHPDSSDRALQAFGRLLFCGSFAHASVGGLSSSLEKEALLENRAWCVRQLLQRPHSYVLTLLTGHFCSLSGRWPLAVAEYSRAHRLVPRDDLTCLCLSTSYLNLATSRSIQDRHGAVLRGFAVMSAYASRRRMTSRLTVKSLDLDTSQSLQDVKRQLLSATALVYKAEVIYNFARAFHQFNILHMATSFYIRCIQILSSFDLQQSLLHDLSKTIAVPSALLFDVPQLRFCAYHNLALIYRSRGASAEAKRMCLKTMTWGD